MSVPPQIHSTGETLVGILVLSHGPLARALLASARTISGDFDSFEALSLDWRTPIEDARRAVVEAVERLDHGAGVLVLTDIFGGTPSNIAAGLETDGRVRVIAGVNLPMVVRLGCRPCRSMPLEDMARWIRTKGRSAIRGAVLGDADEGAR